MKAFKENPIITLACRNYCTQLSTNQTKAKSWTALNPNNEDDVAVADLRSVAWSTDWATFCNAIFPSGTVFETCQLTFEDGHKSVVLCLDGSSVYTSGSNKAYYLVEITNGGNLVTHAISKVNNVWDHQYLANDDSSEELLNSLIAVKYDSTTGGGVSAWEAAIKEYVVQSGDTTEVGGNMEIDGDLTVNTELNIGSSGSVGSNLKNAIIPDGTGHLNQVLIHETTGEMWGDYTPANIEYKNAAGTAYGQPLKFVKCSASEYAALTSVDQNTFYIIVG